MFLKIPFCTRAKLRVFEKVETTVDTYHIVDVGLQYKDGQVDSVAFGVSIADRSKAKDDNDKTE